jgi:hypothetical protein
MQIFVLRRVNTYKSQAREEKIMRYVIAALLLATALALPAAAHPQAGFPFNLTFFGDGTITGKFGGVPVIGTYMGTSTSGTFVLNVDGQVFAAGTYSCNGGCTFSGTQLLGASKSFTFTSTTLTSTKSGSFSGLYATHGAWVSGVTKWAKANLTTMRVGQVVRAAASIQGKNAKNASESSDAAKARGRVDKDKEKGKGKH